MCARVFLVSHLTGLETSVQWSSAPGGAREILQGHDPAQTRQGAHGEGDESCEWIYSPPTHLPSYAVSILIPFTSFFFLQLFPLPVSTVNHTSQPSPPPPPPPQSHQLLPYSPLQHPYLLLGLPLFLLPGSSIPSTFYAMYPISLFCRCSNHLSLSSWLCHLTFPPVLSPLHAHFLSMPSLLPTITLHYTFYYHFKLYGAQQWKLFIVYIYYKYMRQTLAF